MRSRRATPTVEEFLSWFRCGLTLEQSVQKWMQKYRPEGPAERKRLRDLARARRKHAFVEDVAPDGGLYSAGPQFRMSKPRGTQ